MFSYLKKLSFGLVISVALGWSFTFAIGTGPVVFHHIYGGGGNTSAPYENDFVVLRNTTTSSISLSGWILQNGGDASVLPIAGRNISLSGTISAGGYYLIEITTTPFAIGIFLSAHVTPNLIATFSSSAGGMGLNNNKLRLLSNTGNVVDFVGWGTITNQALVGGIVTTGGALAPSTSNTGSIIRIFTSGSNSTDFALQSLNCGLHSSSVCLLYLNQHVVTFQDRDTSFISSGLVYYGNGATAPVDPTRTGWTFSGWNQSFSFVTGAMTILAEYNINQYLVTFTDRDSTVLSTGIVNHGSGAIAPVNPARTGYTFSGWNMDFSNITGVTIVTGEYNINQYTITFDSDGGTPVGSITQDFDTSITSPSNPTKTGYTFSGRVPTIPTAMPAMNITITGYWTINSYTLSYTGGGADGGSVPANQTGDYNSTIILATNTYTRAGYSFSGWDCGSEGGSYTLIGDTVCTAEWNINSYTVTFQDHNATFISSGLVTYGSGATAPSNPSRTGYTFSGWNNNFSNVTGDLTVIAQYNINSYSITFNTDGGTPIMAITGDYNSVIIVPSNPTKAGYIFSGWSPVFPTMMPAGSTTLVAQWILIPVVIPPVSVERGYAGGGGGSLPKDYCPNGDYSSSYYDSQCGTTPTTGEENILDDTISSSICTQADYNLSSFQALKKTTEKRQFIVCRLYANGQTIFDDVPEFDYNRVVTREEASRMITKFVEEILKKDKIRNSNDPLCQFTDLKLANPGLKTYITDSCQYGIFNGTYDHNFLPTQQLNQAHAIATVLRASYGYQDESGSVRFTPYIDMISTKSLTRKTFTKPNDLKVLERRGMTRGNLGELMYRVAIDLL